MSKIEAGDRVYCEFVFEAESIRNATFDKNGLEVGGWITDEHGKKICLVSIPEKFCQKVSL